MPVIAVFQNKAEGNYEIRKGQCIGYFYSWLHVVTLIQDHCESEHLKCCSEMIRKKDSRALKTWDNIRKGCCFVVYWMYRWYCSWQAIHLW